ncbi:MAG: sulfatase-like hydrolase/transferase [Chitinophagales bacterium]|nr:sulfatase-like hydrolase/transferase [Chitinophagales bacterium]
MASAVTSTSVTIGWSVPCGESTFTLNWRPQASSSWNTISDISVHSYTLSGLQPQTSYEVKVQSQCGSNVSSFSEVLTVATLPSSASVSSRNVLLILIDDGRYDTYDITGGPSFFPTPNVSRIANEGAIFRLSFVTQSLCSPSRASIATGVYPHVHGIHQNPLTTEADDTVMVITLSQILKNHGYHNGFIGKWHISSHPQPGYDYWLHCGKENDYFNTKWNYNGVTVTIAPHETDVITDSAIAFLHRRPKSQPFFLWLAYRVPHTPYIPRAQDDGLFDGYSMPLPSNFFKYENNYPGFLYTCTSAKSQSFITEKYRGYFELLQGLETRMADLWDALQQENVLDSTLIIFTSDNGFMMGEHFFHKKRLAYEPSIRVPLFVRCPGRINPGTVVSQDIALNIDIAPTILDYAGIPQTYGMQGVSLFALANGTMSRTEMLYEFYQYECIPDIRAVRTLTGKYVMYHCGVPTEEFFDLVNDSLENTNQVNNPFYADSVQVYRNKLAFWRNYYGDTSLQVAMACSLSNVQRLNQSAGRPLMLLSVFPNPGRGELRLHFISEQEGSCEVRIMNVVGQQVWQQRVEGGREFLLPLNTLEWPAGTYLATVQQGSHALQHTFQVP